MKYATRAAQLLLAGIISVMLGVFLTSPASAASAKPPAQSGTSAISTKPQSQFGSALGQDVNSLEQFSLGGKPYLVVGGDITGYKDTSGKTHNASGLFIVDKSGKYIWGASGISGGYVQAVHARATSAGKVITLYIGGSFTRVNGQARKYAAAYQFTLSSSGKFQAKFSSTWKPTVVGRVMVIKSGDGRIYVGAQNLTAFSTATAGTFWTVKFDCGVRALLYNDGSVYAGGISRTAGSYTSRGAFKLSAKSGAIDKKFKPVIKHNDKKCTDPSAKGHDTYSGANPLAFALDKTNKRLVECEGGMQNGVRSIDLKTGSKKWLHLIDGDGQTCTVIGKEVFVGFHRSQKRGEFHRAYGEMGGFFDLKTGKQKKWAHTPDFSGGGVNRDGRNNGVIASVIFDGKLVMGGAFTGPTKQRFAVFPMK